MMMDSGVEMRRLRTLGRGASGAVVSLFAAGEELVAVKSAAAGAEQLRREAAVMASLRSPHVLPCLGFRAAAAAGGGSEYQLILEFAPGGSLADEAERNGGRLEEAAVRAFAADVARGLAYLHGESTVHGDVKPRNVVIGGDGRAKLADFGCARRVGSCKGQQPIGGTPAFMAPEVARGEEQGPAADVWALGCTVLEMATGRAPWSGVVDDVLAAVRLIGYTDAVPEAPEWMSAEGKDFLGKCLCRDARERWTAEQLLEHPFLALAVKAEDVVKAKWVSPKSTLDAALWESDADDEDDDDDLPESPADRIRALAGNCSALPDWESDDDGWIEVCSSHSEFPDAAAAGQEDKFPTHCDIFDTAVASSSEQKYGEVPDLPVVATAAETTHCGNIWGDESESESEAEAEHEPFGADLDAGDDPVYNAGPADAYAHQQQRDILENFLIDPIGLHLNVSDEEIIKAHFPGQFASVTLPPPLFAF
ncbi:hypothetical protein EJB05_36603, partial [Eragrostis curvula]